MVYNLQFKNNNFPKLKNLYINNCKIKKTNTLLKCPNLEILKITTKIADNNFDYNNIFDFSSFIKLKTYSGDPQYFTLLVNSILLENIQFDEYISVYEFIKIVSLKHLKVVHFDLYLNNFCNIKDVNLSIRKLYINFQNYDEIQRIFPNVEEILLSTLNLSFIGDGMLTIAYIENPKCKIKKIKIKINSDYKANETFNFNIQSYEKLESAQFHIESNKILLEKIFPLFNKNYDNIIFKSLVLLKLKVDTLRANVINNIYNNIGSMPNLEEFILYFNYCKEHEIKNVVGIVEYTLQLLQHSLFGPSKC